MGRYIARRLGQGLVVIFGVTIFVFVITRMIGDPVKFMLPLSATPEQREARRAAMGLDQSLLKQFGDFLGDLLRLDLGESTYVRGQSALSVVFDYLPRTLQLVSLGMLIAIVFSIPLGVLASRRPGPQTDQHTEHSCKHHHEHTDDERRTSTSEQPGQDVIALPVGVTVTQALLSARLADFGLIPVTRTLAWMNVPLIFMAVVF